MNDEQEIIDNDETLIDYMVFDYCENLDMYEVLKNFDNEWFTEPVARFYFDQMLSCVEYLHENGIAHWDLKLENVVLDWDYNLKLIDFGLAENVRQASDWKLVSGTIGYISPEQYYSESSSKVCLFKGDIFSLGVFLFNLVTGR